MNNNWKMELIIALITLLSFALAGCVSPPSTKLGKSYIYQIPSIREKLGLSVSESLLERQLSWEEKKAHELLEGLYAENRELAEELGRIPDFADNDFSDKDLEALLNFTTFYTSSDDPKIEEAITKILNIGLKDKKKFNLPLELIVDSAAEKEFTSEENPFKTYQLWDLGTTNYYYHLSNFLVSATESFSGEQWNDYNWVKERMNDPRLVHLWVRHNLIYDIKKSNKAQYPKQTFESRRGVCRHSAGLATDWLSEAGYSIRNYTVLWGHNKGHTVSVKKDGKKYFIVMDHGGGWPKVPRGPFDSYAEIGKYISGGRGIWRTYIETTSQLVRRNR